MASGGWDTTYNKPCQKLNIFPVLQVCENKICNNLSHNESKHKFMVKILWRGESTENK